MFRSKKSFKEAMQTVIDSLNDKGELSQGETVSDNEFMTIFSSWETVNTVNTLAVIYAGKYHWYRKAVKFSESKFKETGNNWDKPKYITVYDKSYMLLDDLRLGSHDLFPFDDTACYYIPESFQPYNEILESLLGETGFNDEYDHCSNCYKIIRTSPDSYSWSPDYILSDDGLYCLDCVDTEETLEELKNTKKPLPEEIQSRGDHEGLIIELSDIKYSNGFHSGMDDSPDIILRTFKRAKIDLWFTVSPSQFYTDFYVNVRPEDENNAREILANLDVYQGFSNAEEFSKALQGKHSDYVTVTTRNISPEEFINGVK